MLDIALRSAAPGALILVAAFGSGCDVLLLRRTAVPCPGTVPDTGKAETSYLKYLSFTGQVALAWGMRAEMDNKPALSAAWRDHARTERFEGGECARCSTVQFPFSRLCVNPACKAQDAQKPISFVDRPARADLIVSEAARLLSDAGAYAAQSRAVSPYGDGQAARRIAEALGAKEHL